MRRPVRHLLVSFAVAIVLSGAAAGGPRQAAAVGIIVNSTLDTTNPCSVTGAGTCTLRDAITFANNTPGHDVIAFNFSGVGPHIIAPLAPLPALSDDAGATIDGYSQAGATQNSAFSGSNAALRVRIDGSNASGANGLRLQSGANVVRGLSITSFDDGAGIEVVGPANVLEGNFIGLTPDGTPAGNLEGVFIAATAQGTRIGGLGLPARNLVSGNLGDGIVVTGPGHSTTIIQGNGVGVAPGGAGTGAGNGGDGLVLTAGVVGVVIGGGTPNVFAHNGGAGIALIGSGTFANRLAENRFEGNAIAIDLGDDGPTPNDAGDLDGGPNLRQNHPVLSRAYVSTVTGEIALVGEQDSAVLAGGQQLQVFATDAAAGSRGQGRLLIGSLAGLEPGPVAFFAGPFAPPSPIAAGSRLTATMTTADGTSEFAPAVTLLANKRPVARAGNDQGVLPGATVTLDGSASTDDDDAPLDLGYRWTQKSGPAVALSSPTALKPTFSVTLGGAYVFELVVSDGLDESVADAVTVTVNDTTVPVATPQAVTAFAGQPKAIRLRATDGPNTALVFKIVQQPQHGQLTGLNESTGGVIYTADFGFTGTDSFTFTASDGVNTSPPATVTITVLRGVTITTLSLPAGVKGRPYAVDLEATGGTPGYTWSIAAGSLPPGLRLDVATGRITGVPTAGGQFEVTIAVRDAAGLVGDEFYTLRIAEALPFRLFAILLASSE